MRMSWCMARQHHWSNTSYLPISDIYLFFKKQQSINVKHRNCYDPPLGSRYHQELNFIVKRKFPWAFCIDIQPQLAFHLLTLNSKNATYLSPTGSPSLTLAQRTRILHTSKGQSGSIQQYLGSLSDNNMCNSALNIHWCPGKSFYICIANTFI